MESTDMYPSASIMEKRKEDSKLEEEFPGYWNQSRGEKPQSQTKQPSSSFHSCCNWKFISPQRDNRLEYEHTT